MLTKENDVFRSVKFTRDFKEDDELPREFQMSDYNWLSPLELEVMGDPK